MADETIKAVYNLQDQMSRDLKKITKQMDEFNKEAQENNKNAGKMGKAFQGMGKWIAGGAAAMATMKALKFGNAAAAAEDIKDSTENIADPDLENLSDSAGETAANMKTAEESVGKLASASGKTFDIAEQIKITAADGLATAFNSEGIISSIASLQGDVNAINSSIDGLANKFN